MSESKIKQDSLEPLLTLEFILQLFKQNVYFVMGDYFSQDWTWKWNFWVYNIFTLIVSSAICYAWHCYEYRHDMNEFVFSACLIMIDVVGFHRNLNLITHRKDFLKMTEDIVEFTEKWERTPEGFAVLRWYCRLPSRLILGLVGTFALSQNICIFTPVLLYLITGKMILLFQLYIPFIDYEKHPGYEIHAVFHGYCCFFGFFGIIASTVAILIFLVYICIKIDMLRARFKTLSEVIHQVVSFKEKSITVQLKEIFEDHQALIEYIDACEDLFSLQNLTDHMVAGIQSCLALFICLQQFWIPGYILIGGECAILLCMDLLGTMIEMKMEKLSYEAYDVPWYLMSIKDQKLFYYFLGNTQKTDRLSLAGRVPLCLNTFVQLYKRIYSYLMVLKDFQH